MSKLRTRSAGVVVGPELLQGVEASMEAPRTSTWVESEVAGVEGVGSVLELEHD